MHCPHLSRVLSGHGFAVHDLVAKVQGTAHTARRLGFNSTLPDLEALVLQIGCTTHVDTFKPARALDPQHMCIWHAVHRIKGLKFRGCQ
jgi:hypothetical protein